MGLSLIKGKGRLSNTLFYTGIIVIALLITWQSYNWLLSIDANQTLKIFVPIIIFFASLLGQWVVYNYFRIFLFQQKGIKGYQLRGKLTFYLLLITLGSIVIVGGLMVYLIFLIETTIIGGESDVAEQVIEDYQYIVRLNKASYEKSVYQSVINDPEIFSNVFTFSDGEMEFIVGGEGINADLLVAAGNRIESYFSYGNPGAFYLGDGNNIFVLEKDGIYYTYHYSDYLVNSFELLEENMNNYNRFNVLKEHIRPISIISLLIFSVPVLIGAFFLSLFVTRSITSGIEEVVKGTKIIAHGNLDYRVRVNSHDEIEDLGKNFNMMAHRLKLANDKVKRMERLEAWHEVAKRLAHEIKNPLTPIKLSTERLVYAFEYKKDNFSEILDKTTNTIISETKRLEGLVNEFSGFARLPYLKLERKNIIATLNEVIEFYKNAYTDLTLNTSLEFEEFYMEYDENQLKQVLINLVGNSIDACKDTDKYVKISTTTYGNTMTLEIEDHGKGISDDEGSKIFDPYFTTKTKGTGLGLAIAERIVLEHNGNIWFESGKTGTTFFIELPIDRGG